MSETCECLSVRLNCSVVFHWSKGSWKEEVEHLSSIMFTWKSFSSFAKLYWRGLSHVQLYEETHNVSAELCNTIPHVCSQRKDRGRKTMTTKKHFLFQKNFHFLSNCFVERWKCYVIAYVKNSNAHGFLTRGAATVKPSVFSRLDNHFLVYDTWYWEERQDLIQEVASSFWSQNGC